MSVAGERVRALRLFAPMPPAPPGEHGGLKLDWRSEVGRTGVLLAWEMAERPVDGGMPAAVARLVATALCAHATVAGCTLSLPPRVGPEWTPVPGGHACRFAGPWWRGRRHDVGLLASRDPAVVARLFDDADFAWANESQLLLLSPAGTLPTVDRAFVEDGFALPLALSSARLATARVTGLVRAGVDGAVAGLYLADAHRRTALLEALAAEADAAGARWEVRDGATHPAVGGGEAR